MFYFLAGMAFISLANAFLVIRFLGMVHNLSFKQAVLLVLGKRS